MFLRGETEKVIHVHTCAHTHTPVYIQRQRHMFFLFSFDIQSLGAKNFTLEKILKILKEYTFLFILLFSKKRGSMVLKFSQKICIKAQIR